MSEVERDLVDYALAYALTRQVEYAEAKAVRTSREDLVLRNGVLDAYAVSVDCGYNVRVLAAGGLGFASSNRWTKDEARSVVDAAHRYARNARRRNRIDFVEEASVQTRWGVEEALKLIDVSYDEKIQRLVEVDAAITSQPVNVASRQLTCSTRQTERYFVDSEGTRIASSVPFVTVEAIGVTVRDSGKTAQLPYKQYGYTGGWEAFERWQIEAALTREVQQLHRNLTEGHAVLPGTMDVICGPEVTGIACHESCGHPMEADRILGREMSQAGRSFIYPNGPYWLGSRIGSEHVTIIDDPTIAHSAGFYRYDDEGIAARPRYLYRNGVIHEFLQNRETAAKLGTRSNGASRAVNYDREAIVRMANTFLQPGDMTEAELFEDVQQGVYIHSFTEWNIDDVRFNQRYVGREAYLIEDGEVSRPVVRPTIETTTPAFWQAVDGVSKDVVFDSATCGKGDPMQGAPVFTGGPLMRLRGLYIR